jgi:uncharacterized iron-regulated membrane protein
MISVRIFLHHFMNKNRILRTIFKLHSWLGLITGVFLLFVAITGAILVYQDELDKWLNSDLLTVQPEQKRLDLNSLVEILRKRYPEASGTNILHFPKNDKDVYEFRLYDNATIKDDFHRWDLYLVDINPYSGKIIREGNHRDFNLLIQWVHTFHYSLHLGSYGILILAIICFTFFTSILTGIIVYRKFIWKVLLFRLPVKFKNWRTATSDIHRIIGVWTLVFNILIFYSGLEMNWSGFDPELWKSYTPKAKISQPFASLEEMVLQVQKKIPGFKTHYFYIPFEEGEKISAMGEVPHTPTVISRSASHITFNPFSGEVEEIYDINNQTLQTKIAASTYSFHVGSFAGDVSKVLYIFVGLTPGLLSITGFLLWWRRNRKPTKKFQQTASTI